MRKMFYFLVMLLLISSTLLSCGYSKDSEGEITANWIQYIIPIILGCVVVFLYFFGDNIGKPPKN